MPSAVYVTLLLFRLVYPYMAENVSKTTEVTEDRLVMEMIKTQQELCPYVSLCATSNVSTNFVKRTGEIVPCCSSCSCNKTCVESATCCPDFRHQLQEPNITERTPARFHHGRACVKTQHGPLGYNDRYKRYNMTADCPSNYENRTMIRLCRSNFDYENVETFTDHIPVYDDLSGLTYKNRYCHMCNTDVPRRGQFWDIMLNCTNRFKLFLYFAKRPWELAMKYVTRERTCNIVFHINKRPKNTTSLKLEECFHDEGGNNYIKSCKPNYTRTSLEKICTNYAWPIKRNIRVGVEIYNNLACMLCNDVDFAEQCYETKAVPFYTVSFTTDVHHFNVSDSTEEAVIDLDFPDVSGNGICRRGFIFQRQQNMCRQVICPLNFFVKDGECIPMMATMTGTAYFFYLEIVFPTTFNGLDTADLEPALLFAIDQRLRQYVDRSDYVFSLWSNQQAPRKLFLNQKYCVLIHITGQNDYLAFIKFLHWFVILGNKVSVNVKSYDTIDRSIGLRFPNVHQIWRGQPLGQKRESFHLIEPKSWRQILLAKEQTTEQVQISKPVLCYRVALNASELTTFRNKVIQVSETQRILSDSNIQYHMSRYYVCLEDAFEGVPNSAKYILDKNEIAISHKRLGNAYVNKHEDYNELDTKELHVDTKELDTNELDTKDTEDPADALSTFLIASVCTTGILALIICSRKLLRYLTKRNKNLTSKHTTAINMGQRERQKTPDLHESYMDNSYEEEGNGGHIYNLNVNPDIFILRTPYDRQRQSGNAETVEAEINTVKFTKAKIGLKLKIKQHDTKSLEDDTAVKEDSKRNDDDLELQNMSINNKKELKQTSDVSELEEIEVKEKQTVNRCSGDTELQ